MIALILTMCLAPASIATGLLFFRSAGLTFLLFHGGVCLLVPLTDLLSQNVSLTVFLKNCGFRASRKMLVSSLIWGVCIFTAVFAFFSFFEGRIWDSTEISEVISRWGINTMNPLLFLAVMVFGNSFLEEFFWRGYIVHKLSSFFGKRGVILISAFFYSSYHAITTGALFSLQYAIVSTMAVFAAGVVWGTVRVKTASILFPVITHLFADLSIMAAYLKFLS